MVYVGQEIYLDHSAENHLNRAVVVDTHSVNSPSIMSKQISFHSSLAFLALVVGLMTVPFFRSNIETTVQAIRTSILPSEPTPRVKILSYDPFIAHISNFITDAERTALKEVAAPLLAPSTVYHMNGTQSFSQERTSSTAYLPYNETVVQKIFKRAAEFQGFLSTSDLDMQVTSYQPGQQYTPHHDWFHEEGRTKNRLSTFFAILETDCSDCGTQFPSIKVDWSQKSEDWCEFVDCSQEVLTTRNIVGGAVFWRNLDSNGDGRWDTIHAGLPAINGTKVGLNIWTDIELSKFEKAKEAEVLRP